MAESQTVTWDADDRLTGDLYCVSCGYNLRGLERSGVCGECGTPLKWSLAGDQLYGADPVWVKRLRVGAACLTLTLPWLWLPPAWVVFAYGLWCITAPDPKTVRGRGSVYMTSVRLLLAAFPFVVWLGVVPLCATYWYANAAALKFDPSVATTFLMAGMLLSLPLITSVAIWRIAGRAESKWMKRCHRNTFWLSGLSLAFVGAWGVNELATLYLDLLTALGVIGVLLGLVGFGFLAGSLVGTWRRLEQAEVQARALRSEVRYWQRLVPGS